MNKIFITLALIGSIALGGCGTLIPGTSITWPSIGQVQAAVALSCSFVPTASSVAAVIAAAAAGGAGSAIVATAGSIATAICGALQSAPTVTSLSRQGAAQTSAVLKIGAKTVTITGTYLIN